MKKLFVGLGIVFACLVVIAAVGFAVLNYIGTGLDRDSKAFVDETIPLVVASWNPAALISRASPELHQVAPPDKVESLFRVFAERLGPMKAYQGSRGDAKLWLTPQGKSTTAAYLAAADFEKGAATITIRTIRRNGQWQILEFRVDSPAFLPSAGK